MQDMNSCNNKKQRAMEMVMQQQCDKAHPLITIHTKRETENERARECNDEMSTVNGKYF